MPQMRFCKSSWRLSFIAISMGPAALAAPVEIVNYSFEDQVQPRDGNPNSQSAGSDDWALSSSATSIISGWTIFDDGRNDGNNSNYGNVSHAPDSFFNSSLTVTPEDDANDQSFFSAERDIYQVLTATLQANTTYTLTVDIGDRSGGGVAGAPGNPEVHLGYGATPGTNYLITLENSTQPTQIDGDWVEWSGQFTTGPTPDGLGEVLRIELTNGTNVGWFDNVRLDDGKALSGPNLAISASGTDLVFTWDSQTGKVYDLLSSTDPEADGDPATWTVVANQEDIIADPPSNMITIERPADPARLYVIREENAPPPPPAFFDDFESDQGWDTGIGANHLGNTAWELGPPDTNFVDGPDSGANGSATCYGTDLDNNYQAGTEIWLRSPSIDLTEATGATLSFWHIFDVNGAGDETGVVRVLRSSDNSLLGEVETFSLLDLNLLDWFAFSEALPAAALGETIRLEFLFTVAPGAGQFFPGWYIDEVKVEVE